MTISCLEKLSNSESLTLSALHYLCFIKWSLCTAFVLSDCIYVHVSLFCRIFTGVNYYQELFFTKCLAYYCRWNCLLMYKKFDDIILIICRSFCRTFINYTFHISPFPCSLYLHNQLLSHFLPCKVKKKTHFSSLCLLTTIQIPHKKTDYDSIMTRVIHYTPTQKSPGPRLLFSCLSLLSLHYVFIFSTHYFPLPLSLPLSLF